MDSGYTGGNMLVSYVSLPDGKWKSGQVQLGMRWRLKQSEAHDFMPRLQWEGWSKQLWDIILGVKCETASRAGKSWMPAGSSRRASVRKRQARLGCGQKWIWKAGLRHVSEKGAVRPGRGSLAAEEVAMLLPVNTKCSFSDPTRNLALQMLGVLPTATIILSSPSHWVTSPLQEWPLTWYWLKSIVALSQLFKNTWKYLYCLFSLL